MRIKALARREEGLVSIIITMILTMVLSLIVLGFARLSRNEQRQSLDRQLSTQALYAAESGINLATKAIANGFDGNITDCGTKLPAPYAGYSLGNNTDISCLLIDQTPSVISFDAITVDKSTVFPINSVDDNNNPKHLKSLTLTWQKKGGGSKDPSANFPRFPPTSGWSNGDGAAGILRIDLVPTKTGELTRNKLVANVFTIFAYPKGGATDGAVDYTSGMSNQGKVVAANCTGTYICKMTINFLSISESHFYIRLKSIYADNQVELTGVNDSGDAHFKGGQVKIDVTGRAADILKRIQVGRSPTSGTITFADQALDVAQPICKLLSVVPGPGSVDGCNPATPTPTPSNCPPTSGDACASPGPNPSPNPNGNAAIGTYCQVINCNKTHTPYGNENSPLRWNMTIVNNSQNDQAHVTGCDWDYGDGTKKHNVNCKYLDSETHGYPQLSGCRSYVAKLTMHFDNAKDKTTTKTYRVPDNHYLGNGNGNGNWEFDSPC